MSITLDSVTMAGTALVSPDEVRNGDEFYAAYAADGTVLAWGDGDEVDGDAIAGEFAPSYRRCPSGSLQITFATSYVNLPADARVVVHRSAESGTSSPFALLGLLLALVPITLLVTFSARLAGMLAGTVGGVA